MLSSQSCDEIEFRSMRVALEREVAIEDIGFQPFSDELYGFYVHRSFIEIE